MSVGKCRFEYGCEVERRLAPKAPAKGTPQQPQILRRLEGRGGSNDPVLQAKSLHHFQELLLEDDFAPVVTA